MIFVCFFKGFFYYIIFPIQLYIIDFLADLNKNSKKQLFFRGLNQFLCLLSITQQLTMFKDL